MQDGCGFSFPLVSSTSIFGKCLDLSLQEYDDLCLASSYEGQLLAGLEAMVEGKVAILRQKLCAVVFPEGRREREEQVDLLELFLGPLPLVLAENLLKSHE